MKIIRFDVNTLIIVSILFEILGKYLFNNIFYLTIVVTLK
jgi:hypothetical protein